MANDLAKSPAGSPDPARVLATVALDPAKLAQRLDFDRDGLLAMVGEHGNEALAVARAWLVPLKVGEPGGTVRDDDSELGFRFEGHATARLVDALRPIGIKIAPTMAPQQVGAWLAAMVAALSDLPPRVAVRAAEQAIHVPMQFPNEVEKIIRAKAEPIQIRYELAVRQLERLQREIEKGAKPPLPRLPAPAMTQSDVDAMSPVMIRLGLACGALVQDGERVVLAPSDGGSDGAG